MNLSILESFQKISVTQRIAIIFRFIFYGWSKILHRDFEDNYNILSKTFYADISFSVSLMKSTELSEVDPRGFLLLSTQENENVKAKSKSSSLISSSTSLWRVTFC